uniref:Proteasome 20S subunit alpha 1 n=1 Tax=Erpetoichthys calabaricus TaxID=27687 RepID=A0A8C4RQV2_ERPCA
MELSAQYPRFSSSFIQFMWLTRNPLGRLTPELPKPTKKLVNPSLLKSLCTSPSVSLCFKCVDKQQAACYHTPLHRHTVFSAQVCLPVNFMRQECLDSRFVFDRPLPVSRLVSLIGSKTQIPTQRYGRRPYGVGLLIAGYDDMGPHIFQTCPSANYFDCKAMSIGARSQSARTYLERHMDAFSDCDLNELVKHGLRNVSIGIVGKELEFTVYDDDDVSPFLEGLEERPQKKPPDAPPADKPDEPMEH